ncbi:hypothetical protein EYE35_07450 [Cereibacter sphaeroides]|nr:hypothetical protein EYE35_07450 [Cereibacter sphaeroides]
MVDLILRRDGPRREDEAARLLIDSNRDRIGRLADQLTGGGWSAQQAARAAAPAAAPASMPAAARRPTGDAQPYLRFSSNGRVVIACANSARQLHFLGELRRRDGRLRFVLATAENGFIAPLEDALAARISDLDGLLLATETDREALEVTLRERLDLA